MSWAGSLVNSPLWLTSQITRGRPPPGDSDTHHSSSMLSVGRTSTCRRAAATPRIDYRGVAPVICGSHGVKSRGQRSCSWAGCVTVCFVLCLWYKEDRLSTALSQRIRPIMQHWSLMRYHYSIHSLEFMDHMGRWDQCRFFCISSSPMLVGQYTAAPIRYVIGSFSCWLSVNTLCKHIVIT